MAARWEGQLPVTLLLPQLLARPMGQRSDRAGDHRQEGGSGGQSPQPQRAPWDFSEGWFPRETLPLEILTSKGERATRHTASARALWAQTSCPGQGRGERGKHTEGHAAPGQPAPLSESRFSLLLPGHVWLRQGDWGRPLPIRGWPERAWAASTSLPRLLHPGDRVG